MSAQYLVSFNDTNKQVEILSDIQVPGAGKNGDSGDAVSEIKQKEALYYIVAVITFYVLTFLLLFCKYARFKRKELDDTVPYFALPPDAKAMGLDGGRERGGDLLALKKYGPRDLADYGSSDVTSVTPKVMRVKMVPPWLCKREEVKACDV